MPALRNPPAERSRALSIERLVEHENRPHFGGHLKTWQLKEHQTDTAVNRRGDVHCSNKRSLWKERSFVEGGEISVVQTKVILIRWHIKDALLKLFCLTHSGKRSNCRTRAWRKWPISLAKRRQQGRRRTRSRLAAKEREGA